MAERRFRELSKALRIYSKTLNTWEDVIPEVLLAFHNTVNRTTGYSPAQLLIGQQLRLPRDFETNIASSSLVDLDTEAARQIQREYKYTMDTIAAREAALAKERIVGTNFSIGDYVFVYNDRYIEGVPTKLQIPYKGPYKVTKIYGQAAELSDGEKDFKANVTKLVKLRNFALPQRDLNGKVDAKEEKAAEIEDEVLERATEVTDRISEHKKEGKIIKLAKRKLAEVRGTPKRKSDQKYQNEKESQIEDKVEDEAVQRIADEIRATEGKLKRKAEARNVLKSPITAAVLIPGRFAIANAKKAHRLVQILEIEL